MSELTQAQKKELDKLKSTSEKALAEAAEAKAELDKLKAEASEVRLERDNAVAEAESARKSLNSLLNADEPVKADINEGPKKKSLVLRPITEAGVSYDGPVKGVYSEIKLTEARAAAIGPRFLKAK